MSDEIQTEFVAVLDPPDELIDEIAATVPDNPFYTKQYARARRAQGSRVYAIFLRSGGRANISGCLGFLTSGRLNSRLEITSLPVLHDSARFWTGLFDFCGGERISVLSVHTFSSRAASIEETRGRLDHKTRSEYRIDLTVDDLWARTDRQVRRKVNKARNAGLILKSVNDPRAREAHIELANVSLDRRRGRGESIESRILRADVDAYLDLAGGELLQVFDGDAVASSLLILRSRTGAYAQSSGSSDIGRDLGASHFVFYETASLLRSQGFQVFNLGGADSTSGGLKQFKIGLGGEAIPLESAEFFIGGPLRAFLRNAFDRLNRFR